MISQQLAFFAPPPERMVSEWRERWYVVRTERGRWVIAYCSDAGEIISDIALRHPTLDEAVSIASFLAGYHCPCVLFCQRHRCWSPPHEERVRLMDAATSVATFGEERTDGR